jgi:hypothetical protein
MRGFVKSAWDTIPRYLPFYVLMIIVVFAAIEGWSPETVISPFRLPSDGGGKAMPFGGETVADMLCDPEGGS